MSLDVPEHITLEQILQTKPTLLHKINYYWIALINNQHHKMEYMEFKSRLHRTETIVDYFTHTMKENEYKQTDTVTLDEVRDDILLLVEWNLRNYQHVLWTSRAPFGEFVHKYIFTRDNILDKECTETDTLIKISRRTPRKLAKHSIYIAQELIIMSEFIKNDIDRNDDLLFKLGIFIMNGLILVGQTLWNINKDEVDCN